MKSKSTTTQTSLFKASKERWNAHKYQKKAKSFLLNNACAALFLDPGLGKTSITLDAVRELKKSGSPVRVLIVAPVRICHLVWPAEMEKWLNFDGLTYEILHGAKKDQALEREADIYIINPEGLDWLIKPEKWKDPRGRTNVHIDVKRFKEMGFNILLIDELTKFKHHGTNKFKILKEVLHTFDRRWGLTGSPVANGLLDLFGQMYIIDMGRALGKYITHYRAKYFVPHPSGFGFVLAEGKEEEIYEAISPSVLSMRADDHIDMPQLVSNIIPVKLSDTAKKIYSALEDMLVADLGIGKLSASSAGVRSNKCRQISGGAIYDDPQLVTFDKIIAKKKERDYYIIDNSKIEALEGLIDELQGSPILVAYEYQHEYERLKKAFPEAVFFPNSTDMKLAKAVENKWNNGEIPVLFGQVEAVARGLNLQKAGNHVAFYTVPWNYETYDQLIRRVWRQGNKNKRVFVHHLVADVGIDHVVMAAISRKEHGHDSFFEELSKLGKKAR